MRIGGLLICHASFSPRCLLFPTFNPLQCSRDKARELAIVVLRFTILLMRQAVNRNLYNTNSVEHLSAFLGSAEEDLASAALECVEVVTTASRLQHECQGEVQFGLEPIGSKLLMLAEGCSDRSQVCNCSW